MNKRVSRNGINNLARSLNDMLYTGERLKYDSPKGTFDRVVSVIADMLQNDNENFDRDRFYDAIYMERK